jgi:hypothetical protein
MHGLNFKGKYENLNERFLFLLSARKYSLASKPYFKPDLYFVIKKKFENESGQK